jgi:hypothetical protein
MAPSDRLCSSLPDCCFVDDSKCLQATCCIRPVGTKDIKLTKESCTLSRNRGDPSRTGRFRQNSPVPIQDRREIRPFTEEPPVARRLCDKNTRGIRACNDRMRRRQRGGRAVRESCIEFMQSRISKPLNRSVNYWLISKNGRYPKKQFRPNPACRPFVVVGSGFKPHFAPCVPSYCSASNFSVHGCRVTPRHRAPQNRLRLGPCQYVVLRRHHLADCFPRLCDFSTTDVRHTRHTASALDGTRVH